MTPSTGTVGRVRSLQDVMPDQRFDHARQVSGLLGQRQERAQRERLLAGLLLAKQMPLLGRQSHHSWSRPARLLDDAAALFMKRVD